jgi:hypothetical protein
VDRNGGIEAADIDLLSQAVVQGSDDLRFDFDGDGLLTGRDRFAWVRDLVGTFFGDANLGGSVEFADFVTLADGFGSPGGWANGDFDGDGQVSFPDFVLLADSFGRTGAVPASAVPEPSAICLAALGLICAWRPLVRHIADRPK